MTGALRRVPVLLVVLVAGLALPGCGDEGDRPDRAIDRETFVAAYADLRRAALGSAGETIDPADREAILTRHGITEDDLLRFAEVHGADVDYMRQVWSDVEARLQPPPADSVP